MRHHAGFTLVEVLAAMAFLGIVMPVVVSALFVSSRAAVISERSLIALQLGENKLNEMMLGGAWTSESGRGDFGDQWPGYRWELSKAAWETSATMTELTLDVFYTVQGKERDLRLSTLASETVTEAQQSQ
jgi:prepilin-type N-terminal cleavage/methylation domain-containing protein